MWTTFFPPLIDIWDHLRFRLVATLGYTQPWLTPMHIHNKREPVWLSRFGDGLGYLRPEFEPGRRGIIGFGLIIGSAGLAIECIAIGNHGNPSPQGVGVASAHQPAERVTSHYGSWATSGGCCVHLAPRGCRSTIFFLFFLGHDRSLRIQGRLLDLAAVVLIIPSRVYVCWACRNQGRREM